MSVETAWLDHQERDAFAYLIEEKSRAAAGGWAALRLTEDAENA